MARYSKGDPVVLTDEALENYGEELRGIVFIVSHIATKYMPAKEFYAKGMPEGYHPGYDDAGTTSQMGLNSLDFEDGSGEFPNDLYDWELEFAKV